MSDLIRRAEEAEARRADRQARVQQRDRNKAQSSQNRAAAKSRKERRKTERWALKWVRKHLGVEATVVGWPAHVVQRLEDQKPTVEHRLELEIPDVSGVVMWYVPSHLKRKHKYHQLRLVCPACISLEEWDIKEWRIKELADLSAALGELETHQSYSHGDNHQANSA